MSKLEKKVWLEFLGSVLAVLFLVPLLYFLASQNVKSLIYAIIMVVAGGATLPFSAMAENKIFAGYDEREKKVMLKVFRWSAYVFIGYVFLVGFGAFFMVGSGGVIRVVHIPVFLLVGLFVAAVSQIGLLYLLNSTESDDE